MCGGGQLSFSYRSPLPGSESVKTRYTDLY